MCYFILCPTSPFKHKIHQFYSILTRWSQERQLNPMLYRSTSNNRKKNCKQTWKKKIPQNILPSFSDEGVIGSSAFLKFVLWICWCRSIDCSFRTNHHRKKGEKSKMSKVPISRERYQGKTHMDNVGDGKSVTCDICGVELSAYRSNIRSHIKVHTTPRPPPTPTENKLNKCIVNLN